MIEIVDSNKTSPAVDSLYNSPKLVAESIENISIFDNHLLGVESFEPIVIISNTFNSFLYWLLGISILITIAKIGYYKQFKLSLLSNFSLRNYSILQQFGSTIRHPMNAILLLAYILCTSLFLSLVSFDYVSKEIYTVNTLILQNIIIVSGIFFTTTLIAEIFRYLFQIDSLIYTYYESTVQSYNLSAVVLSISMWFIIFSGINVASHAVLLIISLLYIHRIFNILLHIRMKNKYGLFHYIIYICTVEILPLIIAIKLYFIMVL
ncbi:MAG: DUF4271 domain-containing protein [Bacteroidales bacterium]|nr:DUF4271 domain-containing protein [Bacteroidales bacterium]